ncbi:hypothetical protein QVD17_28655 [Tagetes erecta]|uniref:UBC core domain-containing protein n=1 Tax=Tagetes erecta TaxID=13708 RepID=A0AAD8KD94_TARER|nr:hypothetical protein QVD17_28655 [Tagetes erecta]
MDPYNIVKSMDFIKLLSRSVLAPRKGTISGSKDTVFEGTEYKLSLSFPNDYPFKPPKDKWSSAYDVRSILISIQSLLGAKHKLASEHACSSALE